MATWGSNAPLKFTVLATEAAETGETVTVGNPVVAAASTTGSDLTAYLGAVADLASPSGWTNLIALTGQYQVYFTTNVLLSLVVAVAEDATDGMRAQALIDGTVVGDITVIKDAAVTENYIYTPISSYLTEHTTYPIYCQSSFTVRACRKGTFTEAGTSLGLAAYKYFTVTSD